MPAVYPGLNPEDRPFVVEMRPDAEITVEPIDRADYLMVNVHDGAGTTHLVFPHRVALALVRALGPHVLLVPVAREHER